MIINSVFDSILNSTPNNPTPIHHFYLSGSTRLKLQSFDIRLDDEAWVGTPLRRNLLATLLLKSDSFFQEKNLRRKQRRLAKKESMMRPVRQGTPIPDLAPPSSGSEQFKIAATVLTDKNSSIIVDLSNYRPFTAASSGDEPFLVRVSNFLQSGFCKRVFFIFLYWDHLYPTSKLQASFVMWVSVSWISMLNLLGRNLGCSGAC